MIQPNHTDTVKIKLDNAIAADILNKLKSKTDDAVKTQIGFNEYFKGLRLSSTSNSNLLMGFSNKPFIRIYYNKPSIYTRESTVADFTVSENPYHFNNIATDRSTLSSNLKLLGSV